jgi:hypothetical protein
LKDAPECERLFGLLLLPARILLDRFLQILVEIAPKLRQIGAARGENALTLGIVRQRIEQMLQREVRVPPGSCLAVGDGQNDFKCRTEHKQ